MDSIQSPAKLEFTGERVVPGKTPLFLVLEHLLRYHVAVPYSAGLTVLDLGCGTGYGTAMLAEEAKFSIGVDSDLVTIQYAQKAYQRSNLHFAPADCRQLPFPDGSFGLVVSFEVIEHIQEQDQCLSEVRRVLSPEGILVMSTPNALRSTKVIEDFNPFHHKELTEDEFKELLERHFRHVQLLYQHEISGSIIQSPTPKRTDQAEIAADLAGAPPAKYFVAVCGAQPPAASPLRSVGVSGIEDQIRVLQDVREARRAIDALLQQREENTREYARNLAAHRQEIDALLRQREENQQEYARNLAAHRQEIDALKGHCDRQQIELEWLYRWVPVNRLARKLLFGRNLRKRMMARLHLGP